MTKKQLLKIILRLNEIGVQCYDLAGDIEKKKTGVNPKWLEFVSNELSAFAEDLGQIIATDEELSLNDLNNREDD